VSWLTDARSRLHERYPRRSTPGERVAQGLLWVLLIGTFVLTHSHPAWAALGLVVVFVVWFVLNERQKKRIHGHSDPRATLSAMGRRSWAEPFTRWFLLLLAAWVALALVAEVADSASLRIVALLPIGAMGLAFAACYRLPPRLAGLEVARPLWLTARVAMGLCGVVLIVWTLALLVAHVR
jgi:hypothetical protein